MTPPRVVSFSVVGCPRPKGSHDPMLHPHTGQIIMRPASRGLRGWEDAVRIEAQKLAKQKIFFTGAVRVLITFTFARPKSVSQKKRGYMTVAPDIDKLLRSCFDPLTKVLWTDDCLVTEVVARKVYGASDEPSHALITIAELAPFSAEQPLLAHTQESLYDDTKKAG